jgi:putative transposase
MTMSTRVRTGRVRPVYEFIKAHRDQYPVDAMCRILDVAPSGDYDWLGQPVSKRAQEDARLLRLIRASFVASQGIYGAPRVFLDLREAGETCSKHRVARLMRVNNLRALHGYRTRRWVVGKPSVLIPNILQRQFTVTRPNKAG